MRVLLFLLIPALICTSFLPHNPDKENPVRKAKWLIGTWECVTPRIILYETWVKINELELAGKSYYLMGGDNDTVVLETISLRAEKGKLVYIVNTDQNEEEEKEEEENGKPVRFTSTLVTKDRFVFENPTHDFPQVISYRRLGSDSLIAEISVLNREEEEKNPRLPVKYPMRKMKK